MTSAGPSQSEVSLLFGARNMSTCSPKVQLLGREGRPGVDGSAKPGTSRSLNHGLNADLSQAVSVCDQSRVLSGDFSWTVYLVDARQHPGNTAIQRIVGRTATHGEHGIATEGGFCEDALEGNTNSSFFLAVPRRGG